MEFVPLLVVGSLILALVNTYKMALAGQWAKVGVQAVSWAVGIALAFLLSGTDWAQSILIGSGEDALPLGDLGWQSLILVGVALAAVANVAYDALPISTPTPGEPVFDPSDDPDGPREPGEVPDWARDGS